MKSTHIGEVVRSNTVQFSAVVPQALLQETLSPVKLGQLVKVATAHAAVFGIVSFIEQSPIAAHRQIVPHGKTKEELRREMPQVLELVHTEFTALTVGFYLGSKILQAMPPTPPDLHDFVYHASHDDVAAFLKHPLTFLRLILQSKDTSPDEVIVAFFRNYQAQLSRQDLIALGKELSYLLADDYRRLESILTRIYD
jgi:hypothetical protein